MSKGQAMASPMIQKSITGSSPPPATPVPAPTPSGGKGQLMAMPQVQKSEFGQALPPPTPQSPRLQYSPGMGKASMLGRYVPQLGAWFKSQGIPF